MASTVILVLLLTVLFEWALIRDIKKFRTRLFLYRVDRATKKLKDMRVNMGRLGVSAREAAEALKTFSEIEKTAEKMRSYYGDR